MQNNTDNELYQRGEHAFKAGGQHLREAINIVQRKKQPTDAEDETTNGKSASSRIFVQNDARWQVEETTQWAAEKGILIVEPTDYFDDLIGEKHLEGTEATAWADEGKNVVTKAITTNHYHNLKELLESILCHNITFPDTAMKVINIGVSIAGGISVIVEQPLISDSSEIPTRDDIMYYMTNAMGFTATDESATTYIKGGITISDLNAANVIRRPDGRLAVIDCDARIDEDAMMNL